jgi:monoamine oxidase
MAICTIPLSQMQRGRIAFQPALSSGKLGALQRVHMGNAMKVWAVFSQRFWPEDVWDVVCTHRLYPEFSMCRYTPEDSNKVSGSEGLHCVTGFVCGERAAQLSKHSTDAKVQLLVRQLDEVLGTQHDRHPASASFVRGSAVDWSKVPFIEGGYSSPSLGAKPGDRNLLAQPEGDVLFFAGEHTHPCISPCLQAAMETGDRAAAQVLLARLRRRPPRSRL